MTLKEFRIQRALGTLKFDWLWADASANDGKVAIYLNNERFEVKVNFKDHTLTSNETTFKLSITKILLDEFEKTLT